MTAHLQIFFGIKVSQGHSKDQYSFLFYIAESFSKFKYSCFISIILLANVFPIQALLWDFNFSNKENC